MIAIHTQIKYNDGGSGRKSFGRGIIPATVLQEVPKAHREVGMGQAAGQAISRKIRLERNDKEWKK